MQPLELPFSLAQKARIGNHVSIGVRVELLESHIDAHLCACRDMFHLAFCLHDKLDVVAISPLEDAYSFDLLDGKRGYILLFGSYQTQATNATAIGERDMLAIRIKFPSGDFVLY